MSDLPPEFFRDFEKARTAVRTSDATDLYNCFAFAAGDESRWWDPQGGYWPSGVPRSRSLEAVFQAFAALGYARCTNGDLVAGVEKVAIFVQVYGNDSPALVTHAARQLENGRWTSKLGEGVDIEHDLSDLFGRQYGYFAHYLSRPRPTPSPHAG